MVRISSHVRSLCLLVTLLTMSSVARAQDAVLEELYGSGVHAYFAGDMTTARQDLSAAIDGGTQDPRAYYFRALVLSRQGNSRAAADDMKLGAQLESKDVNQTYHVSKSLERVQGSARLMLEKHRTVARVTAQQAQRKRNMARYEALRRAEAQVLRASGPGPSDLDSEASTKPARKAAAKAAVAAPAEEADPFSDPATTTDEAPAADAAPADTAADPFSDPAPGDAMPADDAGPAEAPADDAGPAEMPAEAGDDADPFGAVDAAPAPPKAMPPEDAGADEMPADEMPVDAAPAKKPAAGEDKNPFGDDADQSPPTKAPAKPAMKKGAKKAPEPDVNPFGE